MTNSFNQENILPSDFEKKAKWIKTARSIYWVLTIFFAGTMLMAGIIGYAFVLMAAAASHAFCGDSLRIMLTPVFILLVLLVSYRQWKTGWM